MEILQNKYLRNGGGESMYSPEGSLASPSVWPDKEKERMITVTSGLKCSGLYGKSGPLGSLVVASHSAGEDTARDWKIIRDSTAGYIAPNHAAHIAGRKI